MRLTRSHDAVHVATEASETASPEVQSQLVGYCVVVLHAEFEIAARETLTELLCRHYDARLRVFYARACRVLVGRFKISDLASDLGNVVTGATLHFKKQYENDPRTTTLFNNLVTHRNQVGHGTGSNMTVGEVQKAAAAAEQVLAWLEQAAEAAIREHGGSDER